MSEFVVALSIGLGMIFSLLLTEVIGLTAGGIILPGWVALHLHNPFSVFITFFIALIVFVIVEIASKFMFIYGKRRLVISLLLGFLIGLIFTPIRRKQCAVLTGSSAGNNPSTVVKPSAIAPKRSAL